MARDPDALGGAGLRSYANGSPVPFWMRDPAFLDAKAMSTSFRDLL